MRGRQKFYEDLIAYFACYNTDRIENGASNNSSIVECVFVVAVTFFSDSCIATNVRRVDTRTDGRVL
jgi:hypothetical protein